MQLDSFSVTAGGWDRGHIIAVGKIREPHLHSAVCGVTAVLQLSLILRALKVSCRTEEGYVVSEEGYSTDIHLEGGLLLWRPAGRRPVREAGVLPSEVVVPILQEEKTECQRDTFKDI